MAFIGNLPTSATFAIDSFNGDNSTVNFTLREAPVTTSSILVFVGGIRQHTDTYSLSGTTLAFSEAPPTGTNNIQVLFLGLGASPHIPSDFSVSTVKIQTNAITGDKIAVGQITSNLIAANAVTTAAIADGAVNTSELAAGAVTGDKIGLTAITSNLIAANAVTTAAIADAAVNTSELAAGAVTGDKIGLTAINANNIVNGTITGAKIASTTITGDKIGLNAITGNLIATSITLTSPTLTTPALGTPSSGTLANCTVDGTDAVGFRNIPVNSQSAAYTAVLADSGKVIFHPSTDANARTFTIPANSSVAYPIGTAITFINMTSQVVTIAITTDTMYLSSAGTTGSRSLAQYGSATAIKMTTTTWLISGSGLT